jgi:hypothetical protein
MVVTPKSKLHLQLQVVTLNGHGGYTKEQITLATTRSHIKWTWWLHQRANYTCNYTLSH